MVGSRVFKAIVPQRSVALGLLAGVSVVALVVALPSLSAAQQQDLSLEEIFGVPADEGTAKKPKKKEPLQAEESSPSVAPAPTAPENAAIAPAPDLLQPISPSNDVTLDLNALDTGNNTAAANESAKAKKAEADALMESMFGQTPAAPVAAPEPVAAPKVAPPAPVAAAPTPAPAATISDPENFFGSDTQPSQPVISAPAVPAAPTKTATSPNIKQLLDESQSALEPVKIPAKPHTKQANAPTQQDVDIQSFDAAPPAFAAPEAAEIAPIIAPEPKPAPVVNNTAPAQLYQLEQQAQPPAPPPSLLWDQPGIAVNNNQAPLDLTQFRAPEYTGASVAALPSLPPILVRLEFIPYTSALAPSTLNAVQQLASALQGDPSVLIELQGFADLARKSSLDASRATATRRAENVAQALIEAGVAPERIRVNGIGLDFMPGAVRDRVDVLGVR